MKGIYGEVMRYSEIRRHKDAIRDEETGGFKQSRKPTVTLKHINNQKRAAKKRNIQKQKEQRINAVMYSSADERERWLDIRAKELEVKEREVDLALKKADLAKADWEKRFFKKLNRS